MIDIIQGDCRKVLQSLPEKSIQCVVTSPPYWGQRDYGTSEFIGGDPDCDHLAPPNRMAAGFNERWNGKEYGTKQNATPGAWSGNCGKCGAEKSEAGIGLERDVQLWVQNMVEVFQGIRRVLRDDGTVWLNLGDKYASSGGSGGDYSPTGKRKNEPVQRFRVPDSKSKQASSHGARSTPEVTVNGLKSKDLIGLPWRVAFALQDDGWYLRRDIIWHKPNPMPESTPDRPSTAHEYIFLLTKKPKYYYDGDAVKVPTADSTKRRLTQDIDSQAGSFRAHANSRPDKPMKAVIAPAGWANHKGSHTTINVNGRTKQRSTGFISSSKASLRSVWTIATQPFKGAHFATYPEKLVEPCIKAGSKVGDIVLDPFSGSGTTGIVAARFDRKYIGIELNPEYVEISKNRIAKAVGTFDPEFASEDSQGRMI